MKHCKLYLVLLFIFASWLQSWADNTPSPDRPNIIVVIADQMRGDALGILGHPNVKTPNLDKMAEEGVIFSNFFSTNSVCVPSRMSMFSGLYPHQHGSLNNVSGDRLPTKKGTILGYFEEKGYDLAWIGKDSHSYEREIMQSLKKNVSRAREPFRQYSKYVPPYWHGDMYWPNEELHATKNTRDAVAFIKNQKKNEPFFLTVSYFDPHPPYFAPSEYVNNYESENIKTPYYIPPENLSNRLAEQQKALHYDRIKESDLRQTMKYYYASIEWGVDHQVGQIIQALKSRGIEGNTIVIFTSEHGDFMGQHHMVRKGMFLYDALLHVPFIVYGPGQIANGVKSEVMASGVDIFPTLIDMTGGTIPKKLPGKSLKPVLQGASMPESQYTVFASAAYSDLPNNYFENPEPPQFNPPSDSNTPFHSRVQNLTWETEQKTIMARTREWKLILNESRPPELYHMNDGWVEKENVAYNDRYQGILNNLKSQIEEVWPFWKSYQAFE